MMPMDAVVLHWLDAPLMGFSQLAAGAFVASLWQGAILAAGTWLSLRMLPKATAAIRFAVWTAVFAVLAALPFLHAHGASAGQALTAHGAMLHLDVRWSFAIAGLWALISLVRAATLVASGFRLHGIWKRAVPVEADFIATGANRRRATLCTSRDVDRPSVIGFFSPRILIPGPLFEELSGPELEQIVLHEMGHLRRRDDWMNLVQKIGLVLFPLNPIMVWIERRLCFERELACDDDVLRLTRAPKAYARCLTNLAEHRLARRAAALSLGAWEHRTDLGRRVHSILRRGDGMGRVQARVAFGALILALLGGATELARCPRIVSFADATPEAEMLPAISPMEYHPAVATGTNAAHETLLKASAPSATAAIVPAISRRSRHISGPVLRRAKKSQPTPPLVQRWVVMTSWGLAESAGPSRLTRMVLTVPVDRGTVPSFAAVSTGDGWLVLQL